MILVLVMAFNTSVALALGFVLGRIYQIRSDLLERRAEPRRRHSATLITKMTRPAIGGQAFNDI